MLGLFDFTLWTGSHIFRNSNIHNKRSKGSYRKVRKIQMLLLWLNHKNQVKWSNHHFFRWISTAYNTVYYIIKLGVFFHPLGKTDMLRNNGSFMFPINSFIFCSLIILATTSSSAQEFPEFQKESGIWTWGGGLPRCNWSC